MLSLKMNGPFEFDVETIEANVSDKRIGNYALGYKNEKSGNFVVCYVGRATDQPLKERLKQHIGEHPKKYKYFKYSYASTPKEAYLKECINYHDFGDGGSLFNEYHPSKIPGDDTLCPICKK